MLDLTQLTHRADVTPALRRGLIDCWTEVTDNDAPTGFPFPPIAADDIAPVLDTVVLRLAPDRQRLLVARSGTSLIGWVALTRDANPLLGDRGTVNHLQTRPSHRKRGVGSALLTRLRQIARDEMHLTRLQVSARGGIGLEHFHTRLGWTEAGRWPRPHAGEHLDEVLLVLTRL